VNSTTSRELTLRALLTGVVIGAVLTPCNVYSGLKIGWSFNMSIAAALLSFAFWRLAEDLFRARHWGLLENNINQTTASSAASIISGGLVAPIPALTLLTGQTLGSTALILWVFTVSALGIVVATLMRNPMIARDSLAFPAGTAAAETLREIHGLGREAALRVRMLFGSAVVAGGLKLLADFLLAVPRWSPSLSLPAPVALAASGTSKLSFKNLGLALDPSLLMIGFGAIIGLRAGLSLLLGAVLAWVLLAPWILAQGWVAAGAPKVFWFGPLVEWLIWPGVTLMTTASLTAFLINYLPRFRRVSLQATGTKTTVRFPVPTGVFVPGAFAVVTLAVVVQQHLFAIPWLAGLVAVALSLVLAIVAARVVGETGIAPIGAIGKVAQLSFGVVAPGNATANLMGANVTGGAAGQCADLLNDLKCGALLGATPSRQIFAQCFGVLTGSVVGSLTYLILIPDPASMLLTAEWPAPAVATWKAVAEVLSVGLHAIPAGAGLAMLPAAVLGVGMALGSCLLPARIAAWIPSASAVGLAFVIPAWISLSLFFGAAIAALAARLWPAWSARFVLAIAAGLVAGESLAGIAAAMARMTAG
jgi:uncharacterized oligopeptide transporter (OPT) family protein